MGHFLPQQIMFRGLGLVSHRKHTTRNLTQPNSPTTPYYFYGSITVTISVTATVPVRIWLRLRLRLRLRYGCCYGYGYCNGFRCGYDYGCPSELAGAALALEHRADCVVAMGGAAVIDAAKAIAAIAYADKDHKKAAKRLMEAACKPRCGA